MLGCCMASAGLEVLYWLRNLRNFRAGDAIRGTRIISSTQNCTHVCCTGECPSSGYLVGHCFQLRLTSYTSCTMLHPLHKCTRAIFAFPLTTTVDRVLVLGAPPERNYWDNNYRRDLAKSSQAMRCFFDHAVCCAAIYLSDASEP